MRYLYIIGLFICCNFFTANAQVTSLHEDFTTCSGSSIPASWIKFSVTGNETWRCNTSGNSGSCAYMNGNTSGTNYANEDWLITPSINLSTYTAPQLSFYSRNNFNGNQIVVLLSSNYSGSGDPNNANWVSLNAILPLAYSNVWTLSDQINLTAYKNSPFRIAFKYTSTSAAAASWKIDDVNIMDGSMTSLSRKFINIGQCAANTLTSAQSFTFTMSAITGNFTVDVAAPFQLSKDNISFANSLTYTSAATNLPQTVYVRLAPTVANKVYRKNITFSNNGSVMNNIVQLLGTSIPDKSALRVFSWNMRWFGSPSMCSCDTNVAKVNATQILKDAQADIYCLQEIVSNSQLAYIASQLGSNYSYQISPFCTGVTNPNSGYYQSCQKLGFIYNTQKIQQLGSFGLLASTYPADTTNYYNFSSGRFPYIFKATMNLQGGGKDTLIFCNIHAKADNNAADYTRRVGAAKAMTDSLVGLFPGKKVVVIGDYNDYLEGTTVTSQTVSPYQYLLNNGYKGITLPSLYPTQSTYIGSTNHIIDNMVCSNNLYNQYIDSSFFIFTETANYTANMSVSTSDHYPIMGYYAFSFPTGLHNLLHDAQINFDIENPSSNRLHLMTQEPLDISTWVRVFDGLGNVIYRQQISSWSNAVWIDLPSLTSGLYWVEVSNEKGRGVQKWVVQ